MKHIHCKHKTQKNHTKIVSRLVISIISQQLLIMYKNHGSNTIYRQRRYCYKNTTVNNMKSFIKVSW